MRLFWRSLAIIFLVIALISISRCINTPKLDSFTAAPTQGDIIDTRPTFWLDEKNWIAFELLQHKSEIRILSHPALRHEVDQWEDIQYEIDYELQDNRGETLFKSRYHHSTTHLPSYVDQVGEIVKARAYAKENLLIPTLDQNFYINLKNYPQAHFIRMKSADLRAPIEKIGIRLFQQLQRSNENASLSWHRSSSEKKQFLSRHHIFPLNLISAQEKVNLMSRYWLPLGPMGVEEVNYTMDTVYIYPYNELPRVKTERSHTSYFVGTNKHLTFPIEVDNHKVRLLFKSLQDLTEDQNIQIRWQDPKTYQTKIETFTLKPSQNELILDESFDKGLLEITSNTSFEVNYYIEQEQQSENNYLRAVRVNKDQPLSFDALNNTNEPKIFKLDFRLYNHSREIYNSKDSAVVTVIAEDDKGVVLSSKSSKISSPISFYERFVDYKYDSWVSEKQSVFLKLPPNAKQLKITSDSPVLVTAYNRPHLFPVRRMIPQDGNTWFQREERIPIWFSLNPDNWQEIIRENRTKTLVWQYRPKQIATHIQEGNYAWETLPPTRNDLIQQSILVRQTINPQIPIREEALKSWYKPIDQQSNLEFVSRFGEKYTQPSLIFHRKQESPVKVSLNLDGAHLKTLYITGKSGKLTLPIISCNLHLLQISYPEITEEISWFINSVKQEGEAYLERTVFEIPKEGLEVEFTKKSDEANLSWHYFSTNELSTSNINLAIAGNSEFGLHDNYTLKRYQYEITQEPDQQAILITQDKKIHLSAKIRTLLNDDMPIGSYLVKFEPQSKGRHFVLPYTLKEGREKYRFFKDYELGQANDL